MSVREEFLKYRNEIGAYGWDPSPVGRTSDNMILSTAIAIRILEQNQEVQFSDYQDFHTLLKNCWVPFQGLNRYPNNPPTSSHDDHTAATAIDPIMAYLIWAHGSTHNWIFGEQPKFTFKTFFNNPKQFLKDYFNPWLGRFPHLVVSASRSHNQVGFFHSVILGLEYLWHGFFDPPKETSVKILLWLIAPMHYDNNNKFLTWCIDIWEKRMIKYYGTMNNLMNGFHKNPDKPYVKFVKPEFIRRRNATG